MATNGCVEILSLDTNTNAILFSQYYASKSAKSRLPPKIELRIVTDLIGDSNDDCCSSFNTTFMPAS